MRAVLFVSVFVTGSWCSGQSGWTTKHYTSSSGLPQNSVLDLALDSIGMLWLTTEGGLVRYDGQVFRNFVLPGVGRPRSERMRELFSSPSGEMLATDAKGAVYMIHAHHAVVPMAVSPTSIGRSFNGIPSAGLFLRMLDTIAPVQGMKEWARGAFRLLPFDDHRWAASTAHSILWYEDSTLVGRVDLPGTPLGFMLLEGDILCWDTSGAAFRIGYKESLWRSLPHASIRDRQMAPEEDHDFYWHLGDPHAVVYRSGRFFLLTPRSGLSEPVMADLGITFPDPARPTDVIWSPSGQTLIVGTSSNGLFVFQRTPFNTKRYAANMAGSNSFYAQVPLDHGDVLAINANRSAVLFTDTSSAVHWSLSVTPFKGTAIRLANGQVMMLTQNSVVRVDPETGDFSSVLSGLPQSISCLLKETDTLWVGEPLGLGHIVDQSYTRLPIDKALDIDRIEFIQRGPDGQLWLGTDNGLFRFSARDGVLRPIPGLEGMTVRTMAVIDGLVFIGTYGNGAFVQDASGLHSFPLDHRGFAAHVHAFMLDRAGFLWRSTNHGLYRCRFADVKALLVDPDRTIYQEYFGEHAGISNVEFNGGCSPPYVKLSNGVYSFPTMDGLVQFTPELVPDQRASSYLFFESVYVDGKRWPLDEYLRLPHSTRTITFPFSTSYWGDPANLQLQYRLIGSDDRWLPIRERDRELRFQNLPTGEYTLEIRSAALEGDVPELSTICFRVLRPWYAEGWVIALFSIAGLALVGGLVWLYARRLNRRNADLEAAVQDRTRNLLQANEALERSVHLKTRLVSIISHDIVSPLRFIAQVARRTATETQAPPDEQASALHDIHFATERLYSNAQNLLSWIKQQEGGIVLRPRNTVVSLLVDDLFDRIRTQASAKGLLLQNNVPLDDVIHVDKDLLGIALSNILMNSVSHTQTGHIRISSATVVDVYHLIISDTGPGVTQEARERIARIRSGGPVGSDYDPDSGVPGLGFVIVSGLMDLLGGDFEIVGEGGQGTTVVLQLPLKKTS